MGTARMLRKEVSPLAEGLGRIHFSRQNEQPQLDTAGPPLTTGRAIELQPPSHCSLPCSHPPATKFYSRSPFPVCPAALISQNTRWDYVSQQSLAVKAQGRGKAGVGRMGDAGAAP